MFGEYCDCLTRRVQCGSGCGNTVSMSDEDVLSFPTYEVGIFELWHKSCYIKVCENAHKEHRQLTEEAHRASNSHMN